jgi:hypothetical protein
MKRGYFVRMRWMVIYGYGIPGGALNLNSTNYPDHGHHGNPPLSGKNPHGRAGNRIRDLTTRPRGWSPKLMYLVQKSCLLLSERQAGQLVFRLCPVRIPLITGSFHVICQPSGERHSVRQALNLPRPIFCTETNGTVQC